MLKLVWIFLNQGQIHIQIFKLR